MNLAMIPDKSILSGAIAYLVGAIDRAPDQGCNWRRDFVNMCRAKNLGIKFLDPTNKVTGMQEEIGDEHSRIMQLRQREDWVGLSSVVKKIVRQDHRSVDLSDFVVFYLDISIHTCGSYFEFRSALAEKKPYFIISPGGKKNVPTWLFGICDHNYMFGSSEEVVDHLSKLASGEIELSDRWVLFREQLMNL